MKMQINQTTSLSALLFWTGSLWLPSHCALIPPIAVSNVLNPSSNENSPGIGQPIDLAMQNVSLHSINPSIVNQDLPYPNKPTYLEHIYLGLKRLMIDHVTGEPTRYANAKLFRILARPRRVSRRFTESSDLKDFMCVTMSFRWVNPQGVNQTIIMHSDGWEDWTGPHPSSHGDVYEGWRTLDLDNLIRTVRFLDWKALDFLLRLGISRHPEELIWGGPWSSIMLTWSVVVNHPRYTFFTFAPPPTLARVLFQFDPVTGLLHNALDSATVQGLPNTTDSSAMFDAVDGDESPNAL